MWSVVQHHWMVPPPPPDTCRRLLAARRRSNVWGCCGMMFILYRRCPTPSRGGTSLPAGSAGRRARGGGVGFRTLLWGRALDVFAGKRRRRPPKKHSTQGDRRGALHTFALTHKARPSRGTTAHHRGAHCTAGCIPNWCARVCVCADKNKAITRTTNAFLNWGAALSPTAHRGAVLRRRCCHTLHTLPRVHLVHVPCILCAAWECAHKNPACVFTPVLCACACCGGGRGVCALSRQRG